ncbi:hypothetical protein C8J57DRAFT_1297604 [Mycena rebaudengoi]|nr:hypothetical protein C8J57DRAFT_1297604 [Mycena rebaudengoi]
MSLREPKPKHFQFNAAHCSLCGHRPVNSRPRRGAIDLGKIYYTDASPTVQILRTGANHNSRPRRGAIDITSAYPMETETPALRPWQSDPCTISPPEPCESRQIGHMFVAAAPCRPHLPQYSIGQNIENIPSISFFPYNGLGFGVAMGLAFYQEGLVMKNNSIELCFPPHMRHIRTIPFLFRWPGYSHIHSEYTITLIDSDTRKHVTYGRIAQQMAKAFAAFLEDFGDYFDDTVDGIRLGPGGVMFDNLRLQKVYTRDGTQLGAEVSYCIRK